MTDSALTATPASMRYYGPSGLDGSHLMRDGLKLSMWLDLIGPALSLTLGLAEVE
ncbi:hypothetical protein ACFWD7_57110 [Streptomyces mirabilis]|uniref:hypothetical protein n=1 Tax=Streptomyces mirabilis TaxID=68239 RepID=UPI00368A3AFA